MALVSIDKVHYNCFHLHYFRTDFSIKYIVVWVYDGLSNKPVIKWDVKFHHGRKRTLLLNTLQPGKCYRLNIYFLDDCFNVIDKIRLSDIQTGKYTFEALVVYMYMYIISIIMHIFIRECS